MRALTTAPGVADSARIEDVAEPPLSDGAVLVRTSALGVCGTDREILAGQYGVAPPGQQRLIIGHELLGVVRPPRTAVSCRAISWSGSCAVPIRCPASPARPTNGTCAATAAIRSAASRSVTATGRSGFASSRVRHQDRRDLVISVSCWSRPAFWPRPGTTPGVSADARDRGPRTVLVTGAGPIGLLAALMGRQRGLEVHVLDHNADAGKADLVQQLGGTYHTEGLRSSTASARHADGVHRGAGSHRRACSARTAPAGIVCWRALRRAMNSSSISGASIEPWCWTTTVFGAVNANREHYELAAEALKRGQGVAEPADHAPVALDRWTEALCSRPGDIKVVIDFGWS